MGLGDLIDDYLLVRVLSAVTTGLLVSPAALLRTLFGRW